MDWNHQELKLNRPGRGIIKIASSYPTVQRQNGNSMTSGTGAPADELGSDGDTYLDRATGELYYKISGVWNATGQSLLGPEGPQGAQGDQGVAGPTRASRETPDLKDHRDLKETLVSLVQLVL